MEAVVVYSKRTALLTSSKKSLFFIFTITCLFILLHVVTEIHLLYNMSEKSISSQIDWDKLKCIALKSTWNFENALSIFLVYQHKVWVKKVGRPKTLLLMKNPHCCLTFMKFDKSVHFLTTLYCSNNILIWLKLWIVY